MEQEHKSKLDRVLKSSRVYLCIKALNASIEITAVMIS